jgi:hypothetical protein
MKKSYPYRTVGFLFLLSLEALFGAWICLKHPDIGPAIFVQLVICLGGLGTLAVGRSFGEKHTDAKVGIVAGAEQGPK